MRRPLTPIVLVLFLSLGALAPLSACGGRAAGPEARAAQARTAPAAAASASQEELDRYAAREQSAAGLEKFQGGRADTTTIIIVLLLVIIIVLIV